MQYAVIVITSLFLIPLKEKWNGPAFAGFRSGDPVEALRPLGLSGYTRLETRTTVLDADPALRRTV